MMFQYRLIDCNKYNALVWVLITGEAMQVCGRGLWEISVLHLSTAVNLKLLLKFTHVFLKKGRENTQKKPL